MSELGQRLREVRQIQGRSLRGTAQDASISPPYLQKIERGEVKQPSPAVLHGLASALNVPYADLMELAGHLLPTKRPRSAGVNVLAQALSAENLSSTELEQLAEYLAFLRRDRRGNR